MWSLCGGREGKAEAAAESSEDTGVFSGSEAYRPNRGLAREMIDEQAMAPSAQVEVPAGTPRSNFVVGGRGGGPAGAAAGWPGAAGPSGAAPATLSSYNTANVQGFRQQATAGATSVQGGGSAEVDAQSEILGEELKKEGNQLYNEGQLEAAELVYSEALKYAPKNYILYSNRSMCYGKLGRYVDALSDAKTVVTMMPTWAKGFARLAAALEALGRDKDAVAAYEKAKWLAQVHDNDPHGEAEYEEAAKALRLRVCTSATSYEQADYESYD